MKKIIKFYRKLSFAQGVILATTLTFVVGATASSISGFFTFTPGTVISASQMNSNFDKLESLILSNQSQRYSGTWNANTNAPDLTVGGFTAGEYYVVTTAGTNLGHTFAVGDWAIYNGSAWDKMISVTAIPTVFGRTGAIAAVKGDYNLNKMADVDLVTTPPVTGQVLKYVSSQWVPGNITETDPTVSAFAKTALPTCSGGQTLFSNGSTFSCVTQGAAFSGTVNRAVVTDGSGSLTTSAITTSELGYISGVTSAIQTQLNTKEPMITSGSSFQYLKGNKTLGTLATDVLAVPLTGLTSTAGNILATDTISDAFNKFLNVQGDYLSKTTGATITTGTYAFGGTAVVAVQTPVGTSEAANKGYVDSMVNNIVKVTTPLTAVGYNSGGTSSNGTFVGYLAGSSSNGTSYNTYIGNSAGQSNTSGINNTFVGYNSGMSGTTSSENTLIGFESGLNLSSGSSNVGIGKWALKTSGTKSGNTAIGTSALMYATTGSQNISIGLGSGNSVTSASNNIFIGNNAGGGLVTGGNNVVIGGITGLPSGLSDTIIFGTASTTSTERMRIDSNGNVGIGTTSPAYMLTVNGTAAGTSGFNTISDIRYKKDIVRVSNALEKILALDGVSYHFRNDEFPDMNLSHRRELGVIAQKVEKVFPEAVMKDSKGFRSVTYTMLIAPIIEAIKEMNFKTKHLEEENKMLKDYLCAKDPNAPFCE